MNILKAHVGHNNISSPMGEKNNFFYATLSFGTIKQTKQPTKSYIRIRYKP